MFLKFKAGLSFNFSKLVPDYDIKAGARYLYFDTTIWFATGSIGRYFKERDWYVLFNFFIGGEEILRFSGDLTVRRYFGNMDDHVLLQIGWGIPPDGSRNVLVHTSYFIPDSKRIAIGFRKSIKEKNIILLNFGYSRDELASGAHGNQLFGTIAYSRLF